MRAFKLISSLVFLSLLLFKVSCFHAYSHHEDHLQIESCELCEDAITNQTGEFLTSPQVGIPFGKTTLIVELPPKNLESPIFSVSLFKYPFSRPPPTPQTIA